jgi:hypothetical protein
VPWCDDCSRFWSPNTLPSDGACPTCGRTLAKPGERPGDQKAPWHFKLLVAAVVAYLGWRAVQAVEWVVDKV